MIERLGASFAAWAERWMPGPFVLVLGLTVATLGLGMAMPGATPLLVLRGWGDGFWGFLTFAMQMAMVLVTGHALASSGPVHRAITALARLPRGTRSAAGLAALVSVVVSLLHWGLGLILGALLAREIGRAAAEANRPLHYPLVVAGAYAGFVSWHGGLTGSAPLKISTPGHFLEDRIGVVPLADTLGSSLNLVVAAALVVAVPLIVAWMAPRGKATPAPRGVLSAGVAPNREPPPDRTPALRAEESVVLGRLVAAGGLLLVGIRLAEGGFRAVDFNFVNFAFLFLGLAVHGSPGSYARAVAGAVRGVSGILLQFPFYAGILGAMKASGLLVRMAEIGASTGPGAFPVAVFFSAGIVNVFVPSGGGQWGVQGPVVVEAAARLGVPLEKAVMALAYGDAWTNLLQPFWALALLGVTGLRARDIMGYTVLVMLLTGPIFVAALLAF
ncbi:MAG: TIGR00366 family protein [Gemmatimonadota bacterium]|nr:short-chain fatty acid transporter [Gemmatimonadota bacterium]MDP6530143.1 TIGR00366 family protein [Gemmatimonadota bacterium]MDP6803370.1 TIGR00366 family protein [Gemmatimonadota bacterium]MDP7032772.1 TIGR00366 family protein [Gemmatimonadota bacterium]